MRTQTLQKRIEDLEQAGKTVQPWHIGVMEWMKIYEQIYESTANPDDPLVKACMENTKRYKQYFDDLEAGVVAPRWQ